MEDAPNLPRARSVFVFENGMILTFDRNGLQIPTLGGPDTAPLREAIRARADPQMEWTEPCTWDSSPWA